MPKLITPNYIFRDGIPAPYFQTFHDEDNSEIIHAECASTMWDREFPVYPDELHEMQCLEDIICPICEKLILKGAASHE